MKTNKKVYSGRLPFEISEINFDEDGKIGDFTVRALAYGTDKNGSKWERDEQGYLNPEDINVREIPGFKFGNVSFEVIEKLDSGDFFVKALNSGSDKNGVFWEKKAEDVIAGEDYSKFERIGYSTKDEL